MIVVRVELHSAVTGQMTEIARMKICNDGSGSDTRANYNGTAYRGRSRAALDKMFPQRTGRVLDHPRKDVHVWHLVAQMLKTMLYV